MAHVYTKDAEVMVDELGLHLHSLLASLDETKELAEEFGEVQEMLRDHIEVRKEAKREIQRRQGALSWAERDLFLAMKKVQGDSLHVFHNNRKNKTYRLLFPGGLTAFNQASRKKKESMARLVIHTLNSLDLARLNKAQERLEGVFDEYSDKLKAYEKAQSEYRSARNQERMAKSRWTREYKKIEASLTILFHADRVSVQAFFKTSPYTKKGKKEKTEEKIGEVVGEKGVEGEE